MSGDYESAEKDCDEIQKALDNALAQELLGNIHYKRKNYSEAKKCYMKAIVLQANPAQANSLGMTSVNLLEKYREACKQQKMADN